MNDEALGLTEKILRRDYLYGSLLAEERAEIARSPSELMAGAAGFDRSASYLVAPAPPGSAGDGVVSIGPALLASAKAVTSNTGETFDLVVIGGGLSGLAAAYYFHRARKGQAKILILENHAMFGGNSGRDEFTVRDRLLYAPQASTVIQDLSPALAPSAATASIFQELGIELDRIRVPEDQYFFGIFRDDSGHAQPTWYPNIFAAPLEERTKQDLGTFFQTLMHFYEAENWRENLAQLDRLTFRAYVAQQGWTDKLYKLLVPELGAFFGFPDAVSAACVYSHYASKGPRYIYGFPGGNSGLARYLVKSLIPGAIRGGNSQEEILNGALNLGALDTCGSAVRLRLSATAVRVEHEGSPDLAEYVAVTFAQSGKLYRLQARTAILAGGGFVTRQIVTDLPGEQRDAYASFVYAPLLWVNVVLNNSRALNRAALNLLSTYPEGFGCLLLRYENIAGGKTLDSERPSVLGVGCPRFYPGLSAAQQEQRGRTELMETSFLAYERRVREDLVRVLGPWGFDPKREIDAIFMHRWAQHGYVFAYPGFFSSTVVERACQRYGRIAFAHTDLHKFSLVMGAVEQGHRAAQEVLRCLGQESQAGAAV